MTIEVTHTSSFGVSPQHGATGTGTVVPVDIHPSGAVLPAAGGGAGFRGSVSSVSLPGHEVTTSGHEVMTSTARSAASEVTDRSPAEFHLPELYSGFRPMLN